ncbi:MAG: tyrosine-protein phosphatase [Proteobacteria bacterium]|nr:tyrosine-protein phosphatase [Pseudomonadota bacterium]
MSEFLPERRVELDGTFNFRDLGGYETQDGRRVRWGRVYRSDSLADLSDEDFGRLRGMGIKRVCDFRTQGEIQAAPDRLPQGGGIEYLHLPVMHGRIDPVAMAESIRSGRTEWLTDDLIIDGYRISVDEYAAVWGTVVSRLADTPHQPLVFHCTAGKDRTGVCAALLLLVLGVPEEQVIEDHQLSNRYMADRMPRVLKTLRRQGLDPEKVAPFLKAPREGIVATIEHALARYGSIETYFRTLVGLNGETMDRLRSNLLE